ncbi:hypothetical protein ANCCAN_12842 [Ancylostoma caninum]|uniref:Uncharacterized protein n=1 Tax=Ancylostoma caninum TaxID=29170 RepID=A0A368G9W7_ANCCA|nr:hypothetical protein ANCCAN_12842 [Ancylostoma caninum]
MTVLSGLIPKSHVYETRCKLKNILRNADGSSLSRSAIGCQKRNVNDKEKRRSRAVETAVAHAQSNSGVLSPAESTLLKLHQYGHDIPFGPMWSQAQELAGIANQFQLPDLAKIIGEAMRNHRATSTFNQYARELRKFPRVIKNITTTSDPNFRSTELILGIYPISRKA